MAVLGCGLSVVYPKEHAKLMRAIAAHGAVISEYPLSEPPYGGNFPKRNRIISGLCQGVLIVEGAQGSGALITASLAEKQGRDVYLSLALDRMDAYRKAEAHLMNPVQEVIYLRGNAFENGIHAGEYSLSERSEFGYPSYKEYAVFGKSRIVSALQSEDPGIEMKEKLIRI